MEAVKALLEATPDTPSYMIGVRENKITRVPLMEAVAMVLVQHLWESRAHGTPLDTGSCRCYCRQRLWEGDVIARPRVPTESGGLHHDVYALQGRVTLGRQGNSYQAHQSL